MNDGAKERVAPVVVLGALALILLVLAVLQYRWISQVSEADRERIQAGLENSVRQFRQEFNRELLNLCLASEPRPGQAAREDWNGVADRLENWLQVSPYPGLVSEVYIWENERDEEAAQTLRLNRNTRSFEPAALPPALSAVRDLIEDHRPPRRRARLIEGRVFLWSVVDGQPLIVHPILAFDRRRDRRPSRLNGYLLIELDLDFLRNEFLPELARRYFLGPQGHEYQAAVIDTNTQALVYDSSQPAGAAGEQSVAAEHGVAPLHSAAEFLAADVRTNLVWERRDYVSFFAGGDDPGRPAPPQPEFASPGNPFEKTPGGGGFRGPRTPAFLIGLEDEGWQLAVKHREGSLDSAVASLRRRNLGISFGILVLLAVSVGMIFVSAQRARRLADLQMEFVAGVSHELRTPLAVIRSAADNLADGVVKSAPQVQEYGSVIGREGRRLSTMIEQTLHFAATQTGAKTYELGEVSAEAVIARTLHDLQPAVEEAGFRVETSIEPGLPPVRSNAEALSRLLANLVQNALKYGGDAKWMAVRALTRPGNGKRHVEVRVDDHGPGIDPDDLPHIFEPFYRGKLALSNQIQGSGLGLNLAQRISQAVGASLTVESHPGKGSSFSVRLPVDEDGVPQRLS